MLIGRRTTRAAPLARASSVARSSAAASPDSTGCPVERGRFARQYHLPWRVGVGHRDDAVGGRVRDHRFDELPVEPEHRQHPAGALLSVLLHQSAALAHKHQRGIEVDDVRRHQRRELAQAVAGHVARRNHLTHQLPALAHRVQASHADRQDCGLGVDRVVQVLFGTLEAEPGQREAEDLVGPPKDAACRCGCVVEGFAHAHVLRALSREYESHRPVAVWRGHAALGVRRRTPSL